MPRTHAVGSGHDHGDTAHDKRDQSHGQSKVAAEAEAEERDVEVKEITHPDAYRIKPEKQGMLHLPDGKQAVLQVGKNGFCPR